MLFWGGRAEVGVRPTLGDWLEAFDYSESDLRIYLSSVNI